MTDTSKEAVEGMIVMLGVASQSNIRSNELLDKAAALLRALQEEREWRPIETAPINLPIDVWCVGQHGVASYDGNRPVGGIERNRHKSEKYGWFGNQSDAGVPQRDGPDLQPVAWRYRPPECPIELVVQATGWPATPPRDGE